MKYQNIILVYVLGIIPAAGILSVIMRGLLSGIEGYLPHMALLIMLFHVGKVMQNEIARKRYFVYIGIIVGQSIFFIALSGILGVDTQNTWLSAVVLLSLAATIIVMLFDISKIFKDINEKASKTLHNAAFAGVMIVALGLVFGLASLITSCQIDRLNQLG